MTHHILTLFLACAPPDRTLTAIAAQAAPPVPVAEDSAGPGDTEEPQEVLEDVKVIAAQSTAQENRATCIERFLMDQVAVKQGKAPKGWVQPPFEDYCKPGAPATFIPAPVTAAVVKP